MFSARTARLGKGSNVHLLANHRSWILAAFAATNMAACAAMNFGDGTGGDGGGGGNGAGASGYGGNIDYDGGGAGNSAGDYSQLCGHGACDVATKESLVTCAMGGAGGSNGGAGGSNGGAGGSNGGTGGMGSGGMPGAGGLGGAGGSTGNAGSGGMAGGAGGMAGSGGMAGGAGGMAGSGGMAGGAGGMAGGAGGAPPGEVQCKLVLTTAAVERSCVSADAAAEFAPCNSATDCGPGLGCVLPSDQSTGVCRLYCCGDTEKCPTHKYCAPRPMTEADDPNVVIPVCVDADDCTLLADNQCADGTACTVVRADGTTSCIPPGDGKQSDPCPCAAGYACTKLKNECHKICHTDPSSLTQECDPGYSCQGNAALPDGFGLCISTSDVQ
jgi:hypothetical protein